MGTDIYAYIEVQDGNVWKLCGNDVCLNRNYTLFGLMAGVRSDVVMFEPRGLPSDTSSDLTKACSPTGYLEYGEAVPGHSGSWLTLEELIAVSEHETMKGYDTLTEVLDMMQDMGKGRPTRLVFWFD